MYDAASKVTAFLGEAAGKRIGHRGRLVYYYYSIMTMSHL